MNDQHFQLRVNDNHRFDFTDQNALELDAIPNGENQLHVLHRGKAYLVELLDTNLAAQTYTLRVNGARYTVNVDDELDQLVQKLGLHTHGSQKVNSIKAPMPGLVLNIIVEPGQEVRKGDPLLVLEAMKMENVLKSTGDGLVKSIVVQKGQAVDKGQLLIEMA